jgi:hypothetical protein
MRIRSDIKESGVAGNLLTAASAAAATQKRNASINLKNLHFILHEISSSIVLLLL